MATATHFITEEQYLKMDTHAEYFDGRLIEQPMTGMTHGTWCEAIMHYLRGIGLRGIPEITTHVAVGQWRLPDVLVLRPDAPEEEYPTHPPLIVFEVLSPGQDMEEMLIKLNAYEAMGVSCKSKNQDVAPVFRRQSPYCYRNRNLQEFRPRRRPESRSRRDRQSGCLKSVL